MAKFFVNLQLNKKNIKTIIYHSGAINEAISDNLLLELKEKMSIYNETKTCKKKVYSIAVEFLENIVKHCYCPSDLLDDSKYAPLFIVNKTNNDYKIQAGNLISPNDEHNIKKKINDINIVEKDKQKEYYKVKIIEASISEKGGAGLGLLKVAKASNNKFKYSFNIINEHYTYYIIEITVLNKKIEGMNRYQLQQSEKTPRINFDPNNWLFEMEGNSRPENVRGFYKPIIEHFQEYINNEAPKLSIEQKSTPFIVRFKLDYFNSSSAKFIMDIIMLISNFQAAGVHPQIEWYYEDGDEDMREAGEEFEELIDIKFKYIMVDD